MDFDKIKITDINPAGYNPRRISEDELTKLSNSIAEFGLVDPIIINLNNNNIIGGHQRYEVLLSQYMLDNDFYAELNLIRLGDIGWVFADADLTVESLDNEKALNIALNRISGEWDFEKLTGLLGELDDNGFDVGLTGFDGLDSVEIDLGGDYEPEFEDDKEDKSKKDDDVKEHEQDDYAGGLSEDDVTVKVGDVYVLGNHHLMCGDSSDKKNIDILLNSEGIDLILTDPPYGISIVNVDGKMGGERGNDRIGEVGTTSKVGFKNPTGGGASRN